MDLIKNPIILGILATAVTYSFLYWKEMQRQKENPDLKAKNVNIMIPGVVGALVWFIVGSFNDGTVKSLEGGNTKLPVNTIVNKFDENVELKSNASDGSFGSKSFKLVKKGSIQLPGQDVFLDLGDGW